ncbi:MAG TPA: AraC family transcriptional regulator [Candidatus Mediterraneibacter norfolkensis]|nr:AraC family transcriptional regulator [Candidatus Mediterraneibacter norfolkensis]
MGSGRSYDKITEFRNYFLPEYFPVLLLTGEHWKISDVPSGRLHFHNCLEIGVCHSESGKIELYEDTLDFRAGDVTCIPQNVPHTTYSDPGKKSRWSYIFFNPKKLFAGCIPGGWKSIGMEPGNVRKYQYILRGRKNRRVRSLALQAVRELSEKKTGYQTCAKGLLLALYTELCRIQSEPDPVEKTDGSGGSHGNMHVLAPALEYVEKNYMGDFSMDCLAELCGFSPAHFRRVFSQIMGMTPLEYVNRVRVSEACDLLCVTEMPVLEISESTGFGSVSSFNRSFRRITGTSPRIYRKQIADIVLEFNGWMMPEELKNE